MNLCMLALGASRAHTQKHMASIVWPIFSRLRCYNTHPRCTCIQDTLTLLHSHYYTHITTLTLLHSHYYTHITTLTLLHSHYYTHITKHVAFIFTFGSFLRHARKAAGLFLRMICFCQMCSVTAVDTYVTAVDTYFTAV